MAVSFDGYAGFKHFLVSSPAEYVAHVEINRPEKLNAFFEDMWLELGRIFGKLSHDANVRAVILSAVGERAFTAGLDVQAASQGGVLSQGATLDGARLATRIRRHVHEFQDSIGAIEKCEKRTSPSYAYPYACPYAYHSAYCFSVPRLTPSQPSSWPCMAYPSGSPST